METTRQLVDRWTICLNDEGKFEHAIIDNILEEQTVKIGPLGEDEKSHINEQSQIIPKYNKKIKSFMDLFPAMVSQYYIVDGEEKKYDFEHPIVEKASCLYSLGNINLDLDFGNVKLNRAETQRIYFESALFCPILHIIDVYDSFKIFTQFKKYNRYQIWSNGVDSKTHALFDYANNCGYIYRQSFRDTIEFDIERDFSMKYYGLTSFIKYHSSGVNYVSTESTHLEQLPMMFTSSGLLIADRNIELSRKVVKKDQYNFAVCNYITLPSTEE